MKTLEEKKLLVQMAQMLGEPVDPLLLESIKKEEQLSKIMFGETVELIDEEVLNEEATLLTEADPPVSVDTASLLQKLAQLKTSSVEPPAPVTAPTTTVMTPEPPKVPPMIEKLQKDELQALKKTLTQVVNKINTLSWGGGGTGAVRINDQDDFDRTSYAEGRYLRWINGMFRLDEVNPHDVIYNTTEVNVPYYVYDDSNTSTQIRNRKHWCDEWKQQNATNLYICYV